MKKTLISIFLVVALICMQVPIAVLAVTDETTNFLLDENFDNWDGDVNTIKNSDSNLNFTITKDAGVTSESGKLKLSTKDSGNVKFQMQPKNSANTILYPNSTVVFSADFLMEDYESLRRLYYYGGPSYSEGEIYRGALVTFERSTYEDKYWIRAYYSDSEASTPNSNRIKYIMPYELDTWYHIDMVMDLANATYDIYVNGTKYEIGDIPHDKSGSATNYFFDSLYLNRIMFQGSTQATENGTAYVDNIYFTTLSNVSADRYAAKSDIVEKSGKIGYATTFDIPVIFDNAINISTYEEGAIALTGGDAPIALAPVWNSDAKGFTVTVPEESLAATTTYSLVIDGVEDVYGNTVTSDISFQTASTTVDYLVPPEIAISADVSAVTKGSNVLVTVDSIDANDGGNITKVEYYDNGVKIGEVTEAPYNYTVNNVTAGAHSIMAVAYSGELCGDSNAIEFTVADAIVTNLTPTYNNGASASEVPVDGVINFVLTDSEKAQMANGADFHFVIEYKIPQSLPRIFMGLSAHDALDKNNNAVYYKEANSYALLNASNLRFREASEENWSYKIDKTARIFASDAGKNAKIEVNLNYLKGTYSVATYVNNDYRISYEYDLKEKFADNAYLRKITEITSFDFKFDTSAIELNSLSASISASRPAINSVVFKDTAAGTQTEDARLVAKNTDEIVVTFSEAMNEESFNATSVTLTDIYGEPVAFTGTYNNSDKTYTLDLGVALDYAESYVLTLTNDIKSAGLVNMSDTKVVTFSTPQDFKLNGIPSVNGKQVTFAGSFENFTPNAQPVTIILAAYDSNHKLLGAKLASNTVNGENEWRNIALYFSVADDAEISYTKVFAWDALTNLVPLIPAK